jgi:pimeloyl-ACP methyl ester carboxylesterase
VHIEQPDAVAALVLEFLGPPVSPAAPPTPTAPVTMLPHARAELALHELRGGDGRTLLVLHGLAERAPHAVPSYLDAWTGPIYALDFTGHGQSTIPEGGGYTAEMLLADADTALRHLGAATVFGRGLGAYVALLLAGARPDAVHGAILFDGPGLNGGGTGPGSSVVSSADLLAVGPPDPYAVAELSRDIRPPDYATNFARLATQASPLEHPITVAAVNRPEWLDAVVREPGVVTLPLERALNAYMD